MADEPTREELIEFFWSELARAEALIRQRERALVRGVEHFTAIWEPFMAEVAGHMIQLEGVKLWELNLGPVGETVTWPPITDPSIRRSDDEDDDSLHISMSENDYEPGWRKMYCGILLPAEERLDAYDGRPWCQRCVMFRKLDQ